MQMSCYFLPIICKYFLKLLGQKEPIFGKKDLLLMLIKIMLDMAVQNPNLIVIIIYIIIIFA